MAKLQIVLEQIRYEIQKSSYTPKEIFVSTLSITISLSCGLYLNINDKNSKLMTRTQNENISSVFVILH